MKHYNLPPVLGICEMYELIMPVLFSDYTVWHKMVRTLRTQYYSLLCLTIRHLIYLKAHDHFDM